jgi:DNA-binding XRE family transcriptional regulator
MYHIAVCNAIVGRPGTGWQNIIFAMPTDPRIIFGKRVRELRLQQDLSQEKLAELAGLHRNYVGVIERGQQNISLVNIVKLAHGLNVRPAKLMDTLR